MAIDRDHVDFLGERPQREGGRGPDPGSTITSSVPRAAEVEIRTRLAGVAVPSEG